MEETKNTDEKKEGEKPESTDTGEGDKSEMAKETDAANAAAERLEKANEKKENLIAKAKLAGVAEAGQETKKKEPLSDIEYAEAMERGEVNPLKDDAAT